VLPYSSPPNACARPPPRAPPAAACRRLAFIREIRAAAPGHIKVIYFNDPVLIGEGLTTRVSGHDDHLHVRYCEAWHPVTAYRCALL
jgi:hypothetical protein